MAMYPPDPSPSLRRSSRAPSAAPPSPGIVTPSLAGGGVDPGWLPDSADAGASTAWSPASLFAT